jgi:ABC-type multidrug transport system ATPase subunit
VADRVAFLDEGRVRVVGPLETLKHEVLRVTAVFEADPPDTVELPGQIDAVRDGRVLSVVARCPADELATQARNLGAREVEVEPLSLEEIVVACLKQHPVEEEDHV